MQSPPACTDVFLNGLTNIVTSAGLGAFAGAVGGSVLPGVGTAGAAAILGLAGAIYGTINTGVNLGICLTDTPAPTPTPPNPSPASSSPLSSSSPASAATAPDSQRA